MKNNKPIKLRSLVNLTEFAPSDPNAMSPQSEMGGGNDPFSQQNSQPQLNQQPEQPEPKQPTPQSGPTPDDPGEYDFTKDFREFEDKKNAAESEAKKEFLDKINEKLLNKTITANASRGYGQPKTDYTIENVKKISCEFWYKDYVVIVTDKNDKKYFLTPGINIKINGSGSKDAPDNGKESKPDSAPAPDGDEQESPSSSNNEEIPNPVSAGGPSAEPKNNEPKANNPASPQNIKQNPQQKQSQQPVTVPNPEEDDENNDKPKLNESSIGQDPTKKEMLNYLKKSYGNENEQSNVQHELNSFLNEFMSNNVKNPWGQVSYLPYLQKSNLVLLENKNNKSFKFLIPENHMIKNVDPRDIKLSSLSIFSKYRKGSVNSITKQGRCYLLEYVIKG